MQNFITLGQPLVGEKYVAQKRKRKERKIIPNIVDTSFPRAAYALHSDQLFIPGFVFNGETYQLHQLLNLVDKINNVFMNKTYFITGVKCTSYVFTMGLVFFSFCFPNL